MNHEKGKVPRRWKSTEIIERNDSSGTEESSPTDSYQNSPYIQNTSTPIKNKRSNPDVINRSLRSFQGRGVIEEDTDEESSNDRKPEIFSKSKEHVNRETHKKTMRRRNNRQSRRERFRRRGRSQEFDDAKRKEVSESLSSDKRHSENDFVAESRKRERSFRGENEIPITEILKRAQENVRTKYEKPSPLTELTTDKIYIQGRSGFSAIKINRSRSAREVGGKDEVKKTSDITERQNCPPIRVAIIAQKFWKNTGLVCQGILAGMALMHFIMLQVLFETSIEFVVNYSTICEIYTNIFSFLITLCIVSTFDKFDLARFDMDRLREIYADYGRTAFAIPLYLTIFCLHQLSSKTDDQLALACYTNLNNSLLGNISNIEVFLDNLNSWQKKSISKDLLAVFAWLFISVGTRDEAFLLHLESMEKYTNDAESSVR